jgi:hypothetical protein
VLPTRRSLASVIALPACLVAVAAPRQFGCRVSLPDEGPAGRRPRTDTLGGGAVSVGVFCMSAVCSSPNIPRIPTLSMLLLHRECRNNTLVILQACLRYQAESSARSPCPAIAYPTSLQTMYPRHIESFAGRLQTLLRAVVCRSGESVSAETFFTASVWRRLMNWVK